MGTKKKGHNAVETSKNLLEEWKTDIGGGTGK